MHGAPCSRGQTAFSNPPSAENRTDKRLLAELEETGRQGSLVDMKRRLLFFTLAFAVVLIAVGGWTVDGLRWAVRVRGVRPAPATA
jgi:hypothetical protein